MLKESETEETIRFVVKFLSLMAFQLGSGSPDSLATPRFANFIQKLTLKSLMCDFVAIENICCKLPNAYSPKKQPNKKKTHI